MTRKLKITTLLFLTVVPQALAQNVSAPVSYPEQPNIQLPQQSMRPAPLVDDVMTVGRPDPSTTTGLNAPSVDRSVVPRPSQPIEGSVYPDPVKPNLVGNTISGYAEIFDGNTIRVNDTIIVTHGADAPDEGQTCYDQTGTPWDCYTKSIRHLKNVIGENRVDCVVAEVISSSVVAATCFAKNVDISRSMIESGFAVSAVGYEHLYSVEANMAKNKRIGLWNGKFDEPWKYRTSQIE